MNAKGSSRSVGAPESWLEHARSDLRLARLAVGQDVLPEQICFHAQQAVEKALKAILLARHVEFPLTHDLEELLSIFAVAGIEVPDQLQEAGMLTPYAVETRYPGFWGEISETDIRHALALAQGAVNWAEEMIGEGKR
jgi:HEPN domain-containing protein